MANLAPPELTYTGGCPDCGERTVDLPAPLPEIGDDFDWKLRDYDGFRLFMAEELAARFPGRARWTPADLEIVITEALAAILDQLSDMLDRVTGEAYLETARRPESVRRLLRLIGYDAVALADQSLFDSGGSVPLHEQLERHWLRRPELMDQARREGPHALHTQHRMVTEADYSERLDDHPLVLRATSWSEWSGSWTTVRVAVIAWNGIDLDEPMVASNASKDELEEFAEKGLEVKDFHSDRKVPFVPWNETTTIRSVLASYVNAYRMVGQEVILENAVPVPIMLALSVRVDEDYFKSEIRRAILQALGTGPGGFFAPGRLRFGEDLHASDILQAVMAVEGVENACLNRFRRLDHYTDETTTGRIEMSGLEIAALENDPEHPERGYLRLTLHGGRRG